MKKWFYCKCCERWGLLDILSVNRCPHCGADITVTQTLDMCSTASGGCTPLYFAKYEQESILDKIRAEIEQVADEESKFDKKWAQGLKYALKIIDKYKAESEEV